MSRSESEVRAGLSVVVGLTRTRCEETWVGLPARAHEEEIDAKALQVPLIPGGRTQKAVN